MRSRRQPVQPHAAARSGIASRSCGPHSVAVTCRASGGLKALLGIRPASPAEGSRHASGLDPAWAVKLFSVSATSPTGLSGPGSSSPGHGPTARRQSAVREACAYCAQRRHLRRTALIAIVVGIILTLINQGSVIAAGHATAATWVRCGLNFIVPFMVSNAGLLSARR